MLVLYVLPQVFHMLITLFALGVVIQMHGPVEGGARDTQPGSKLPDVSGHYVLLAECFVTVRTGKATILSVKRVADKTPPHFLKDCVIVRERDFLVLLRFAFLSEGVLEGDELDGVSNYS